MNFVIWDRIKDSLNKKREEKINKAMTSFDDKIKEAVEYGSADELNKRIVNRKDKEDKKEEDPFVLENANAQSWNPETHPEGRGDSYVVKAIHYKAKTKELIVEYRWGDVALYKNIDKDFVKRFNEADSKGRFAMKYLYDKPYEDVSLKDYK